MEWRMKVNRSSKRNVSLGPHKKMYNFPKQKASDIFDYILAEDLLGINTSSQDGNNWLLGRRSHLTTNFSSIKPYSNKSGLTRYNSGVRLSLPT
jgi:hypothetical protein